jgi:hypothetical protein
MLELLRKIIALLQTITNPLLSNSLLLPLFAVALCLAQPCAATPGEWEVTGSLGTARASHTATLLPSGKVLVAGGDSGSGPSTSAELYDPATGTWSSTGSLGSAHSLHTATLLSSGKVLVAGSFVFNTAELYDPATGSWSSTSALGRARAYHTATLLLSGKVLAAGGRYPNGYLRNAELYDPGTTVTATQVSGRGSIAGQGDTATFNIQANDVGGVISGSVTFTDVAAGVSMKKAKVRTLTFDGNSAILTGNARLGDGTKVTYSVTATDSSSDGSSDTFAISLSNGYSAGGTLISGDISIQ